MDLQLKNQVAIVTGASRGIGRAIAHELAREHMRLVLVARSGDLLNEIAASIGCECLVQVADLRKTDAASAVISSAIQRFGRSCAYWRKKSWFVMSKMEHDTFTSQRLREGARVDRLCAMS